MLALSGERLNPRGGEKEAGEDTRVAAFGVPGAQFRVGVLFERCALPRQGRLFGNFGDSKEMPSPLKENTHFFFFFESGKEMEELKMGGMGELGNTLIPLPQTHILVPFCS